MSEDKPLGSKAVESFLPSSPFLRAAVSGLLALGTGACSDDESSNDQSPDGDLSDEEVDALCRDRVDDALSDQDVEKLCSDMVANAQDACEPEDGSDLQQQVRMLEEQVAARDTEIAALKEQGRALLLTSEEKTISSEQKEYPFAELTTMCDDRGGYTEVHAACGGHNQCAGFSYGDWGPGEATFTEHSCAGANACLGLTCVVLPEDEGRTGKEIYEDTEYGDFGPGKCYGCHAWNDPDDNHAWTHDVDEHDATKFVVFLFEGSTRNAANWLDRPAAEQERNVAFGARGVAPDGTAYSNMSPYHNYLSRAEIERVVEYIRTLDPVIEYTNTLVER